MSFIEMPGLEDAQELKHAPEGEYDLVIENVSMREKEGTAYGLIKANILCILKIEGAGEDYANVMHNISLPSADDDQEKRKTKMLFARRFFEQFGVPYEGGVELEAFVGCRGRAKLVVDEYQGNVRNALQLERLAV
jgi:hypothetical protein